MYSQAFWWIITGMNRRGEYCWETNFSNLLKELEVRDMYSLIYVHFSSSGTLTRLESPPYWMTPGVQGHLWALTLTRSRNSCVTRCVSVTSAASGSNSLSRTHPTQWQCSPVMIKGQQVRNISHLMVLFTPSSVTVFSRDDQCSHAWSAGNRCVINPTWWFYLQLNFFAVKADAVR